MTSWLEPLIDPHALAVAAQRGDQRAQAGLALLLNGQLLVYERLAAEAGWPRLGRRPLKSGPRQERLLAAVGLQLTGGRGVDTAYEQLGKPGQDEPSFATTVAVLRSLNLAEEGKHADAIGVLHSSLQRQKTPLARLLLGLHIGVQEAERGDLERAIKVTEEARSLRPQAKERAERAALQAIAAHNVFHYRQQLGKVGDPFRLPLRGSALPLVRGSLDISAGLAQYLRDQFELATRDPNARTIHWRSEDPVEMPLLGALLRAECLADWDAQRRTRALLGRYYVVSKLGTREGVMPSAFDLLRRAGDFKAVQGAARSVAAIGPLGSLRAATTAILSRPWPRPEGVATLALLSGGADLLQATEADRALSRLRSAPDLVVTNAPEGLRALARVMRSASDSAQTSGSRFARTLAQGWPEPLVLQRMGQVVEAVRWATVSRAERKRWIDYISKYLLDAKDERFLAERAAGALARVETEAVSELLLRAYESSPSIDRLAFLADADISLPREMRARALDEVAQALDDIREEAHGGSYGFGGADVALLMLSLIRRNANDPRWEKLIDFLLDEHVGIDAKSRTFAQLGSASISIPSRIQARLRENVSDVKGFTDTLAASPNVLRGVTLRLWLRLGGVERDELLSRLLQLGGDLDGEARREAARTLPAAQRRLGDDAAFTLGLTLTRDHDYSVRAAAARSLAVLRKDRAGELGSLAADRLELLLAEPGTDVPHETLAGLIEAQREGEQPRKRILDQVVRVRRSHPSRRVQQVADLLLQEIASPGAGPRSRR